MKKLGLVLIALVSLGAGCELSQFTPHDGECHFNENWELDCSDAGKPFPLRDQ